MKENRINLYEYIEKNGLNKTLNYVTSFEYLSDLDDCNDNSDEDIKENRFVIYNIVKKEKHLSREFLNEDDIKYVIDYKFLDSLDEKMNYFPLHDEYSLNLNYCKEGSSKSLNDSIDNLLNLIKKEE